MGICYAAKTLKAAVEDKERLFIDTGCAYGLERLDLVEDDPAKFMRFQMRLVAACINAREMAKLISANPMSLVQGELLFLLATPEGDVVSASYGLAGHIQAFPFVVRSVASLGFEEDPGISPGDVFFNNDTLYGAPHNADCYNFVPIFYQDELIGWTVGLNHITDVGGLQPGGLGLISPSVFTDGFTAPPTKIGQGFKTYKWWELHWKRRTRTEAFNILDDKMRTAGAVTLHDRILEVIDEFGIDYFRRGIKEIIERERRLLVERIRTQAVPGVYQFLHFNMVKYKGVVGRLFAGSNRDWLMHDIAELQVLPSGSLFIDVEGINSESDFHCNGYEAAVRMLTSLGCWPMFAYTQTLNTALYYMTSWNLPPGCLFNPQNPFAGTVMSLAEIGKYAFLFHQCLSLAYFSRGYLEECFPEDPCGVSYGLSGVLGDGFRWAGGDMTLITCWASGATPFGDGQAAMVCSPNPAPDLGETELAEFLQPTNLNLGKVLVTDYCGHGRFRGGVGIGMMQMITEPGQSLIAAVFGSTNGMGRCAMGMSGGYPGMNDVVVFAHETNIRELLNAGKPYPTSFVEMREWLKEGRLKAGSVEVFQGATPNIPCEDGDLFASASGCRCGWGDVLEREYALIEDDVRFGRISRGTAETVYGAVVNGSGAVDTAASQDVRKRMRDTRREKSIEAREWWQQERQRVLEKGFTDDVYNMYADIMSYPKFGTQFLGMWQLPEHYRLEGLRL